MMRALRGHISGLCLPTYVLDIPGGAGKVAARPQLHRRAATGDTWQIESYTGEVHTYRDTRDVKRSMKRETYACNDATAAQSALRSHVYETNLAANCSPACWRAT